MLRFRALPIVIRAVIENMFGNFSINSKHGDFMTILSRGSSQDPINEYRPTKAV